ncbi:peptidase [Klebsiella aerogenes]|uniref:TolC family outer membrane protein n=1 Tax=Klebsiella aerogenes TaxID=548 RepID=UPI0007359364|nr:TolC family outer membrane protein [Klebsiella aerogenes]KTJ37213.1 peptidase [Klebsiella aerogenes]
MSLFFTLPVYAFSVLDAYALALENDPTFQAALKERDAGHEEENIGKAGLLPRISLNYQNSPKNWQTQKYQSSDPFGNLSEVTKRQQYRSYAGSVSLTQTIFDYEAYAKYKAGIAKSLMANDRFRSKFMNLAVRVISSYINVVDAQEKMSLAAAQKTAYKEQLILNERLMSAGEGTITDIAETQARSNLAEAQLIESKDNLDVAERELQAIVGVPLEQLDSLQMLRTSTFNTLPLRFNKVTEWEENARKHNPELSASRYEVKAARYEVERNKAGFMPQFQLYASHSENNSSSDNTINQKYRTDSIGLQVSMPIYSGGGVIASTRQAAARYGQAKYELDAQSSALMIDLHKQFNQCINGKDKLHAYESAVKSARVQVIATRQSVRGGQRVNVDVLNAEERLYSAERDFAEAKLSYVKAYIGLLNDAGLLEYSDLLSVAQYFTPTS